MKHLFDIIRSFIICLRLFPVKQAIKIPILFTSNVKKIDIKGKIVIKTDSLKRYQIVLGRSGSKGLQSHKSSIIVEKGGQLVFKGSAVIGEGTVLRVDKNATMEIGDRLYCNKNCYFRCHQRISIGDRVTFGWNNTINDADGHLIIYGDGKNNEKTGTIEIGDHVWITTNCFINKNVVIPAESVVALGSVVNHLDARPHSLIGGVPARVLKEGINWQE